METFRTSLASNNSTEYNFNPETLDALFSEQVASLREWIISHGHQNGQIDLCRKWLQIFSRACPSDKVARNCLVSLMQKQLREDGRLDEPFLNVNNCSGGNLESILRELETFRADTIGDQKTGGTFASHYRQQLKHDALREECRQIDDQAKILNLNRELEIVRLQLTEKQIENVKLREIANKYEAENDKFRELMGNFKRTLSKAMRKTMKTFLEEQNPMQFDLCKHIFSDLSMDSDFHVAVSKFDQKFRETIAANLQYNLEQQKHEMAENYNRKLRKARDEMRAKYERRLEIQSWAQRLQVKLVQLKCFSVLRQIFIDSQFPDDERTWAILKKLEEKYHRIVNEIG